MNENREFWWENNHGESKEAFLRRAIDRAREIYENQDGYAAVRFGYENELDGEWVRVSESRLAAIMEEYDV